MISTDKKLSRFHLHNMDRITPSEILSTDIKSRSQLFAFLRKQAIDQYLLNLRQLCVVTSDREGRFAGRYFNVFRKGALSKRTFRPHALLFKMIINKSTVLF
jgi:hypothetical protein